VCTSMNLGISVAGRDVVMTRTYRNTRGWRRFATPLVGNSGFGVIESAGLERLVDARYSAVPCVRCRTFGHMLRGSHPDQAPSSIAGLIIR
jgi:hypothetical protein